MRHTVKISARKEGAIGSLGTEHRTYEIYADKLELINDLAIKRAYLEGLEHVCVLSVQPR